MSYHPSAQGTVAARVKAFQDVRRLEDLSPCFPKPPQVLPNAIESGTITGRGRRKDHSFGTPAAHASRDGTDGIRGDGRPPAGTFNHQLHPSMEEKEEYRLPGRSPSVRPLTSLAKKASEHDNPLLAYKSLKSPRRHRSVENIAGQQSELAAVRSRLKGVEEDKEMSEKKPPGRHLTMVELGDMIDYVQTSLTLLPDDDSTEVSSEQVSGLTTPRTSMVRRWRSARASRKSLGTSTEIGIHHPTLQHDGVAKDRWRPEVHRNESARSPAPSQLDVFRNTSPVKQRAAMFEKMQKTEDANPTLKSPPDRHMHLKKTWKAIPHHEPEPDIEKSLHNLKFGNTVYDRPESSLAPPRFIGRAGQPQASCSSGDTLSFVTARHSVETGGREEHVSFPDNVTVEPPGRKTSTSWLPPWRLFSKGSSAEAQTMEDNANAILEKDEHYPDSRLSIVQSRVQDLLSTHNKHNGPEQHLKRRLTPYPGKVTESELKEKAPSPASLKPSQLRPLQVPTQEIAEALEAAQTEQSDTSVAYTPTRLSMTEKEVINSSKPSGITKMFPQPESVRSAVSDKDSPSKTAPSTPRRGRTVRASMSPRGSGYAMEQAFVISPGRSRSRSRASGNRMLVEVEVRDSPGQEARDAGQKIVFVRADVDNIDEEEEA